MTVEVCPTCDISGCRHIRERAAPKPVTWPEGVTEMRFGVGRGNVATDDGYITINDGAVSFLPTEARQLAALLLAAADYVERKVK